MQITSVQDHIWIFFLSALVEWFLCLVQIVTLKKWSSGQGGERRILHGGRLLQGLLLRCMASWETVASNWKVWKMHCSSISFFVSVVSVIPWLGALISHLWFWHISFFLTWSLSLFLSIPILAQRDWGFGVVSFITAWMHAKCFRVFFFSNFTYQLLNRQHERFYYLRCKFITAHCHRLIKYPYRWNLHSHSQCVGISTCWFEFEYSPLYLSCMCTFIQIVIRTIDDFQRWRS